MVAEIIGSYRLEQQLGEGGMGAVYAARHTLIGRPAAIKVLLPEMSQNREITTRFFNEARAATAIDHPGIVEVYDFGHTPDGSAFLVMELLAGESLQARLERQGCLPVPQALAIVRQVASALAAAHVAGIVHRDLKPDNIFLCPDPDMPGGERIKLLDFGIAKLAPELSAAMTRDGLIMGTPSYMAPEQCRGIGNADGRADLYALGCILYHLLAGRPPFAGTPTAVMAAHISQAPPALAGLAVSVPVEVEALLARLLAKDPDQRFHNARQVMVAVDQIAQRLGGAGVSRALETSGAYPVVTATPTTPHRRRGWLAPAAFGALAIAVGLVAAIAADSARATVSRTVPDAGAVALETGAPLDAGAAPPADAGAIATARAHEDRSRLEQDERRAAQTESGIERAKRRAARRERTRRSERAAHPRRSAPDPRDPAAQLEALRGDIEAGRYSAALARCKRLHTAEPRSIHIGVMCGSLACSLGDRAAAVGYTRNLAPEIHEPVAQACRAYGLSLDDDQLE